MPRGKLLSAQCCRGVQPAGPSRRTFGRCQNTDCVCSSVRSTNCKKSTVNAEEQAADAANGTYACWQRLPQMGLWLAGTSSGGGSAFARARMSASQVLDNCILHVLLGDTHKASDGLFMMIHNVWDTLEVRPCVGFRSRRLCLCARPKTMCCLHRLPAAFGTRLSQNPGRISAQASTSSLKVKIKQKRLTDTKDAPRPSTSPQS